MRLLFVHDRFGAMAGAEVNLQTSAAALRKRGCTLGIVHGPLTGKAESLWQSIFFERFPLARANNFVRTWEAIDTFRPDAVYVHKIADLSVLGALVHSGRPVVRMVHDHDLYCLRSYKYHPRTRRICTRAAGLYCVFPCGGVVARNRDGRFPVRWISYLARKKELCLNRRFQRIIVATEYMKQELIRNGFDPARIEIHAPVPPAAANVTSEPTGERPRIVYAGQVIRGKGVDVLLQSLALVRAPFECVIAGDGHYRPYCEVLAGELGLGERVRFMGYVTPDRLQQLYAGAALAVVSSVWPEPFGAAGLEAMRCGLPVVAFDAGGIREWLRDGETGFLVPWMDREQFARRIEQLLREPALARQLGQQARRIAAERFGFEQYISGLESLFDRVIGEARAQRMP